MSREINPPLMRGAQIKLTLRASVTNYLLTKRRCQMGQYVVRFIREEDGTTAVEYGLMVALITAALVAAVTLLGGNLATRFNTVAGIIAS